MLTKEEHKQRHIFCHKIIDEIIAEYITNNEGKRLQNTNLLELINWSHKQTQEPDHEHNHKLF